MHKRTSFASDEGGVVAFAFAVTLLAVLTLTGATIDYSRAYNAQVDLQAVADAAALMSAERYKETGTTDGLEAMTVSLLEANSASTFEPVVATAPHLTEDATQICLDLADVVPLSILAIAGFDAVPVAATACAALPDDELFEISLVVDVSSSMIENDRFDPMVAAVKSFLGVFADDSSMSDRTKVAIVPFSSRISIGLPKTSWLTSYNGAAAVPSRWTNPTATYPSSKFSTLTWVDGKTTGYYNGKNSYWLGCIEPRSDVDIKTKGSLGTNALTDATPATEKFVAMDHNSESSKSFCPPPMLGLTNDFALLTKAADALTSQGSTRLDAGLLGGWYTLSPKWRGQWPDTAAPLDASSTVHKIVIFMTDGQMNTQYGASSGKLDWLCSATKSTACNTLAETHLLSTCSAMKSAGIKIYTVSYDEDADPEILKKCATSTASALTASRSSSSTNYIGTIYESIAEEIRNNALRLAK